ncbi:response regulator [Roseiterribacter gracilis]|uniref:Response regulator n=1 Tax=Roseiterribacter gracilis TaxID=2812848 RepID=A0A8S8XCG2_9PROT|nr:response regulator [Rhodospirillales bacterium TMPK1]
MNRILLVEDNEANRDMLGRRLVRRGFDVSVAIDGASALVQARESKPDLILMDIGLGEDMDGWEATRRLKADADTSSIPVIALTAHALSTDLEKSIAAGCADFDTKPVDLPRLLAKIERCLQADANGSA